MENIFVVASGEIDSRKYLKDGRYLHYLYTTNIKSNADLTFKPVLVKSNEELVDLDGIKLIVVRQKIDDGAAANTQDVEYEEIGTTSLLAIKLDPTNLLEDINTRLAPNADMETLDPAYSSYAIFAKTDIGYSKHRITGFNINESNSIHELLLVEVPELDFTGIEDKITNNSINNPEFLKFFKTLYATDKAIETQAFKLIYDDKNIDSVVAITVLINSINAFGIPILTTKENLEMSEKYGDRLGIYLAGINSDIPVSIAADNKIHIITSDVNNSLTSSVISFVNEVVSIAAVKSNNIPAPVLFISDLMDRLLDKEASRFDTQVLALNSLLLMNGGRKTIHAINEFLKLYSSEKLEAGMIAKMFATSLGSYYSNAVKLVDNIFININKENLIVIPFNYKDDSFDIVEMRANNYAAESIEEYIRLHGDERYVLVNRSISEEGVIKFDYRLINIKFTDENEYHLLAKAITDKVTYLLNYNAPITMSSLVQDPVCFTLSVDINDLLSH